MKILQNMKVLLVSAHPDDAETSCAGTISKLVKNNSIIWSVYFASCLEEGKKNIGHVEDHRKVCKFLGIQKLIEYNFPVNKLENRKQEIRDLLFQIREKFKPDLILCPSINDFHQDHRAVADCCPTIFRDTSTILSFEVLRSPSPDFRPHFFVILSKDEIEKKCKMIKMYKSQCKNRPYFFSVEKFASQMRMRGTQAKTDYAEAYELVWGRI